MITKLVAFLTVAAGASLASDYVDPSGSFALNLPEGWSAQKQSLGSGISLTQIIRANDEEGPQIDVLVQDTGGNIESSNHESINSTMMQTVKDIVSGEGQISNEKLSSSAVDGAKAKRLDFMLKDEDGASWKGYILSFCGKRNAFAILAYAKSSDTKILEMFDASISTFAIESKSIKGKKSGGLLSQASLTTLSGKIKGNLKRDSVEKVIVAGEPPLTYGSVANFVTFIELIFDTQFTEVEFEATRERFVEYYNKSDEKGKKVLALQGASMLKSIQQGTPAEIKQNKSEAKQVFTTAFKNGAQQGIGYAQVMWTAIEKRNKSVGSSKAKPKKDDWDTQVTEADIDAAIEMLYFMWVASGRDPNDVTQEDVYKLRIGLVQEYTRLDPQIQLVIANAPKIYAALRQIWQSATPQQRVGIAKEFGASLDSMGIKDGSKMQSSGGGNGSMMADLAQNAAWNAAKTWTTTSSR
jgi:hypothetical protein